MLKEFVTNNLFKVDGSLRNAYTAKEGKMIQDKYPDLYVEIQKFPGRTIIEKIYCLMNDITEIPVCSVCGKELCKFTSYKKGYYDSCLDKMCIKETGRRRNKKTFKERYGVEHQSQLPEVQNKIKQTCMKRYGVSSYSKTKEYSEKIKSAFIAKYGVDNPGKVPEIRDKIKITNMLRYGHENPYQAMHIRQRAGESSMFKYGVDNPGKSEEVHEEIKKVCLERYGAEYPLQNEEIREKTKQTCIERYGVDNPLKSLEVRDKIKETNLKRFGHENPNCCEEVRNKIKKTCLERYGYEHAAQSEIVKEKTRQTNLERYGYEGTGQVPEVREKIKQTNLEKYGDECTFSVPEIQEKVKQTNLKNFGVEYPSMAESVKEKKKQTYLKKFGVESFFSSKEFHEQSKKKKREKYFDIFKEMLLNKKIELLSTKEEYVNSDTFKFKCLLCNKEFESSGSNVQLVACTCRRSKSLKEQNLYEGLTSLNINVIQSDRKQIYPLELDIYLPDYRLGIEFDGLYWHSEAAGTDKNYHINKTNLCTEKGIQLIHVFEHEGDNKPKIVKSIILSKLGIYNRKIYARQCNIKEISNDEYEKFTYLNHIQGYTPAKYRYGLYYNDELVQICSFGKSRFKKDEIELIRSCSLINTQVIGGFDRLVKHFVSEYKPKNLVSYVDRRYFDGHGYRNGKLVGETDINYWYGKHGTDYIESRMKYQKHKLNEVLEVYDEGKTEYENMMMNGYTRIWDCGNLKFVYGEG